MFEGALDKLKSLLNLQIFTTLDTLNLVKILRSFINYHRGNIYQVLTIILCTCRTNLTASGPRPNPQGSYHYGLINTTRTIRLANSAGQVNGKQRYAVNSVSFVPADTPLKLADYFKIDGVYRIGSISDNPTGGGIYLDTAVMNTDYRAFIEIVFENNENIVQSWHINGYSFFVVG